MSGPLVVCPKCGIARPDLILAYCAQDGCPSAFDAPPKSGRRMATNNLIAPSTVEELIDRLNTNGGMCFAEHAEMIRAFFARSQTGAIGPARMLGAALMDALQDDFDGCRELAENVKIEFHDGEPIVTTQAITDAYYALCGKKGVLPK